MIGALAATGCLTTWRCHIGSEGSSPAADAAWAFLAPYIEPADAAVFSLRAYVPAFLADRAFIHAPGIAPLSSKNTDLPLDEIVSILERAALVAAPLDEARDECGATDAPFLARASVYSGAATGWGAVSCACERGELLGAAGGRSIRRARSCATHAASVEAECANALCDLCTRLPRTVPLLWRPCITQVSRWDRLKGWRDLLSGFLALKSSHGAAAPWLAHAAGGKRAERDRAARTICNAALVLAGPDPSGVTDDPEGEEVMVLASHRCIHTILTTPDAQTEPKVLADLIAAFDALPPAASRDIFIVVLPMVSSEENALMVNALQRASAVLVQASSREGYGLTVGEARFKRKPVVVTEAAVGLRSQVVDGLDGILIRGRSDAGAPAPATVAAALATALVNRAVRAAIAVNGESKTVRGGLIYNQISRWLGLLAAVLPAARGEERAEKIRALSRAVRAGEADEDASRAAAAAAAAAKAGSAAGA
jgi:trehalose synthase